MGDNGAGFPKDAQGDAIMTDAQTGQLIHHDAEGAPAPQGPAAPAAPAPPQDPAEGGPAAQQAGKRKSRKGRKGRKGRKSRKSRKGRKSRKSRKSRKGRKHAKKGRRTRRRRHRGGQNPVAKALGSAGAQFQSAVKGLSKLLGNDQARAAIIAQEGQLQAAKNQVAAATHSTYKALSNAAAQLAGKPGTGRIVGRLQQAANTQYMTRVPGMYPDHSFRRP